MGDFFALDLALADNVRGELRGASPFRHLTAQDELGAAILNDRAGGMVAIDLAKHGARLKAEYDASPVFATFCRRFDEALDLPDRVEFIEKEPDPTIPVFRQGVDVSDGQSGPAGYQMFQGVRLKGSHRKPKIAPPLMDPFFDAERWTALVVAVLEGLQLLADIAQTADQHPLARVLEVEGGGGVLAQPLQRLENAAAHHSEELGAGSELVRMPPLQSHLKHDLAKI